MKTGRKPKPTKLKILTGNPGKRRLPAHEPQPLRDLEPGDAPLWLGPQAREIWEREMPRLPQGLLGAHHAEIFAQYCALVAEAVRCGKLLEKSPPVVKHANGILMDSPLAAAFRRNVESARKLASELGLTPTSSPRAVAERTGISQNPFELLKKRA